MNSRVPMKGIAMFLVICSACAGVRPAAIGSSDVPASPCGAGILCPESGGHGTLLIPLAALLAATFVFTVTALIVESDKPRLHEAQH